MTQHLEREIQKLKKMVLALSSVVEEAVYKAVKAVSEQDLVASAEVVKGDKSVDEAEINIEEECLKILALHQPVAIDLRFIVAVLKLNSDLERIGDLAVNIAERAVGLSKADKIPLPQNLLSMADKTRAMLSDSLKSLVSLDSKLARQVCAADDEVDTFNRTLHKELLEKIKTDPNKADSYVRVLSVSRNLERVADHATNIAEDVVYMVEGEIIRHGHLS